MSSLDSPDGEKRKPGGNPFGFASKLKDTITQYLQNLHNFAPIDGGKGKGKGGGPADGDGMAVDALTKGAVGKGGRRAMRDEAEGFCLFAEAVAFNIKLDRYEHVQLENVRGLPMNRLTNFIADARD